MAAATTNGSGGVLDKDLKDLLSAPLLTQEVDLSGPSPVAGGPAAGGSAGRTAAAAIRQVLGYRPRANDTKGFVAALNAVFRVSDADGGTAYSYVPRSYSAEVQTDFGALTGAQASLFTRARAALDQSLPLLDGLTPLVVTADPEDYESTRANVRTVLVDLVSELGVLGGPRLPKVDGLFNILLGVRPPHPAGSTDSVSGKLGQLGNQLGMSPGVVNGLDQEQNLTNYLILVDYVLGLYANWVGVRGDFDRGTKRVGHKHKGGAFLGTQLVLISQALAVIAEAVRECYFVMDSVFLGPAERQTVLLDFSRHKHPLPAITLAELLDWADAAVSVELPRLIEDGGKEGVITAGSILQTLADYLEATADLSSGGGHNPTPKFHTARVSRALNDLGRQLRDAHRLTGDIRRNPPQVLQVLAIRHDGKQPAGSPSGVSLYVTVTGSGFQPAALVTVSAAHHESPGSEHKPPHAITVPASFVSDRQLEVGLTLPPDADLSKPIVARVTNPDLQSDEKAATVTGGAVAASPPGTGTHPGGSTSAGPPAPGHGTK